MPTDTDPVTHQWCCPAWEGHPCQCGGVRKVPASALDRYLRRDVHNDFCERAYGLYAYPCVCGRFDNEPPGCNVPVDLDLYRHGELLVHDESCACFSSFLLPPAYRAGLVCTCTPEVLSTRDLIRRDLRRN
jgi:hypothetical protein